jgi:hypothetical protein
VAKVVPAVAGHRLGEYPLETGLPRISMSLFRPLAEPDCCTRSKKLRTLPGTGAVSLLYAFALAEDRAASAVTGSGSRFGLFGVIIRTPGWRHCSEIGPFVMGVPVIGPS